MINLLALMQFQATGLRFAVIPTSRCASLPPFVLPFTKAYEACGLPKVDEMPKRIRPACKLCR